MGHNAMQFSEKSTNIKQTVLLATSFMLVSCLAYSLILKIEATHSLDRFVDFN
jgi:hypothetical protein